MDKEIGKENLRRSQEFVLNEWYGNYRSKKDIIVKLHTGQGKTLIGLLILQSSLNDGKGPVIYICPNNYLVNQTVKQARSFGIKTVCVNPGDPLPLDFLNSRAILVANCMKLFNGMSVFGVLGSGRETVKIGAMVIDDAHKCLDIIRESFSISVEKENENGIHPIFFRLWALFQDSLRDQKPGTHSDILNNERSAFLAVPFWTWFDKRYEVLEILSEYRDSDELRFVWNLIKDNLSECICIFSGNGLEITPRLLPVDCITSYSDADRRIFLSATLTEDAFLIKDMGISPESVLHPISSGDVKYSGERLILLPSLVNINITRDYVLQWIQTLAKAYGTFGVVALTPSNYRANQWESGGAELTSVKNLEDGMEDLKRKISQGEAKNVLVLVNQYDGVDLPDSTCRILTLDSLPSYKTLMDRYLQYVRPYSGINRRKLAQRIEQGMGRAIRGSNDWCLVVITGIRITNFLSNITTRSYLSSEAKLQIEIGLDLVEEMKDEGGQLTVINKLINQCLRRDEGWKQYYKNVMSNLKPDESQKVHINRAVSERNAEIFYRQQQYKLATDAIREIFDSSDPEEKGWLLQLMATYLYPIDPGSAMDIQVKAHRENMRLFRPLSGITYTKLTSTGTRESLILEWIRKRGSYNVARMELNEILSNIYWGLPSDAFEQGFHELGQALGLISDRPEKYTGKGPDNLWHIKGKKYWIVECKNQVHADKLEISKNEASQLLNSIEWFKETYEKDEGIPIIIHSTDKLAADAFISDAFWVMEREELKKLRENTISFSNSLTGTPFDALSIKIIREKLNENYLDISVLMSEYLKRGRSSR